MSSINRFTLLLVLLCPLLGSCGLFGELPAFEGNQFEADAGNDASVDGGDDVDEDECADALDCATLDGASASCVEGSCEYECEAGFHDIDGSMRNGCEYACEPTNDGVETCDGVDNDCNDVVDDLFAGGKIAAGSRHTCALTATGELYCWGSNAHGQLGLEESRRESSPVRVPISDELEASAVSTGHAHTCVVDAQTGSIQCWGDNTSHQAGYEDPIDAVGPTPVPLDGQAAAVAAGKAHTCALTADGKAFCWGDNAQGQLGSSDAEGFEPMPVAGDHVFDIIKAGAAHTCAVSESTYCWGDNSHGQLGTGDTESTTEPTSVALDEDIAALSAGDTATCAGSAAADDEAYCWGNDALAPELATHQQGGFTSMSVGGSLACGLNDEGTAFCGELDGNWQEFSTQNFVDISVGDEHACAIGIKGRVLCWGANSDGQAGNGQTSSSVPQPYLIQCR